MSTFQRDVVLVTGSSRGVGLAIARAFNKEGANVVINYVQNGDKAEAVAQELGALAIQADVTDLEQVQNLFKKAQAHYERPIGIIVNNALGEFKFNGDARAKLEDIQWSDFDKQLRTSIQGALNTTKAALPGFEMLGRGRIVNIGSNLVQNPVVPYHDYTSSKGAMLAFTHTVAAELGSKNVTCNMVAGGLLRLTDASAATPDHIFEQIASVTPLKKVATPKDLAGAVLFFASEWANMITGQQVIVDGGLCMT